MFFFIWIILHLISFHTKKPFFVSILNMLNKQLPIFWLNKALFCVLPLFFPLWKLPLCFSSKSFLGGIRKDVIFYSYALRMQRISNVINYRMHRKSMRKKNRTVFPFKWNFKLMIFQYSIQKIEHGGEKKLEINIRKPYT